MSFNAAQVRAYLNDFNFRDLFIEELGWSQSVDLKRVKLQIGETALERVEIAQLAGVVVYELTAERGAIPDAKTRKAVHAHISKTHHENLLIFLGPDRTQSLWYWTKREGGRIYPREHTFMRGQPADLFLQKLSGMVVDISELDEKGNIPVTEVARKLKASLDVERVTKKFYSEFYNQHLAFIEHIKGINDDHDRRWYASVLLNRLMLIYFLQSKGFINGNAIHPNYRYLQDELAASYKRGKDRYYGEFLAALFFEGFAKPEEDRSDAAKKLVGSVPYLNGGLFLKHGIELRWPDIRIGDKAFDNLFRLFESYSWNLDDTPGGKADEINPDVLGYIFEKYINQKAFGAYYTRTEITQYLCEQTIYNLILDRVNGSPSTKKSDAVKFARHFDSMSDLLLNLDDVLCRFLLDDVLPELKLLDPACGSGAFLVAAMKTLINVYSAIIGKIEFSGDQDLKRRLDDLRKAHHGSLNYYIKREIITNNLFGVDLMEDATEIAKLRLFLALVASAKTSDQLEPLPNIDFNIIAGNSLIGILKVNAANFDELQKGEQGSLLGEIAASTYAQILKDKNESVAQYKKHSGSHDDASGIDQDIRLLQLREHIDKLRHESYIKLNQLLLGDFQDLGIKYEGSSWDEKKKQEGKTKKRPVETNDIKALKPFHWGFEFDDVINKNGGFDAIIANAPWEIFKPNAKEFFTEHSDLVKKKKMDIKTFEKAQTQLLRDPEICAAWLSYLSSFPYLSTYYRSTSQYRNQISIVNDKKVGTDINLYKLFLEQSFNLLRPGGRCGIILQSGIYTDLGTKQLREMLFSEANITALFGLSNEKFIFENVHHAQKFCILVFQKGGRTEAFEAAFRINPREAVSPDRIGSFLNSTEEHVEMSVPLVRRLSPSSLSIMEFKSDTDVHIAEKMLKFPLLGEKIEGVWNFQLTAEFHMTNDSYLFKTRPGNNRFELYEGKMIHQFEHRFSEPRYWVDEKEGRRALLGKERDTGQKLDYQDYRLGLRAVASNTNANSMICSALPRSVFCGNSILSSKVTFGDRRNLVFCIALLDSFVVDWLLRNKVSQNINMFFVYQLAIPRLTSKDSAFEPIVNRAARLICTTAEFDDLAKSVGLRTYKDSATNAGERARLRAELNGLIAHLYGLTEKEFSHILSTFPLVGQSVKDAALDTYREFAPKPGDQEIVALIAKGESNTLEFKSSARWDFKQNKQNKGMEEVVVKTVAAMLNADGGNLLIGVDDDRNILGLDHDYKLFGKKDSRDAYENFLTTLLLNNLGKDKSALISISIHRVDGKDVAKVAAKSSPKPVFVKDDKGEHLYIRAGNSTRQLNARETVEYCKIRWP